MSRPLSSLFAVLLLAPATVAAAPRAEGAAAPRLPLQLSARANGELVDAPGAVERAEVLTFATGLPAGLLAVRRDEEVQVAGWPVAPGVRAAVVLTRRDVYAPDAEVWEIGPRGRQRVPRSSLVFFWGEAEGDANVRVMVSVDPASGDLRGLSVTPEGSHELQPIPRRLGDHAGQHLVGPRDFFLDADARAAAIEWSCGQADLPRPFSLALDSVHATEDPQPAVAAAITSLHTTTIAVDTDNEIMANKFGNNTTTASNYIASLFAAMNVIYERDLLVRLVQGTTYLRTAADPWTAGGDDRNNANKLFEFTNYWRANHSGVNRALALMLSGRGGSGAAGVAWVDALCSNNYGYAFSRVYTSGTTPNWGDVRVTAHELGHNFGSPHTHCYQTLGLPNPDSCFNGESGCYGGTPSCPATAVYNGVSTRGTLMSYCHHIGGCTTDNVFHSASVDLLDDKIQNRVGMCVFPAVTTPPPPAITGVSPNSGPTAGNTLVTITGSGFQGGATVNFGSTAATGVTVVSPTRLTARTPSRATGAVTVTVRNPDGQSGSRSNAYFYAPPPATTRFYTVTPCRLIDTRTATAHRGGPALGGSASRVFTVTGACGIPSTARAVSVNVTVTGPGAQGHFEAFPGNAFPLGTSLLGFRAGQTRAGNAALMLATDGTGRVGVLNGSAAAAHLIVDVNGYWR